jgi:hypothetical protein
MAAVEENAIEDEEGFGSMPEHKNHSSYVMQGAEKKMLAGSNQMQEHDQHHSSESPKLPDAGKNGRKRHGRAISPKPPPIETGRHIEEQGDGKQKVKRRKLNENKDGVRKRRARTDSRSEPPTDQTNAMSSPTSPKVPADPLAAALGDRTHAQGLVQATPACKCI